jgi:light-regulated signal transduction histidine kinase (bacteriophytochrome)
MSTANSKQAKYQTDDLEAALHAETRLRLELEAALRRSHEEFQDFMLSAIHDIREPLRSVSAYCELLSKKNAGSDPESDQFRRYILDGTAKIQTLLTGMVDYAGAGSVSRYIIRLEASDALREAEASVPPPVGRKAQISHDALPTVKADYEKLVKIFRHLLDNASKYSEAAEPTVHISARRDGAAWLFLVQDNGPGIDSAYHERVFAPFKRLHGRQIPGLGLGLAFCRKAVESLGGRIWVESAGPGSTFCFTLPAAD